jgi:uncharacterized protein (DUF1786 family)
MKILAIDIGAGTQDILLFDSEKKIENCISLVLPTPSRIFAERLNGIGSDVHIHGDTIGGGALAGAVTRHIRKGFRVVMEEGAAYSIRNDLDEVRSMGVEIGGRPECGQFQELQIREIDLALFTRFLSNFGEDAGADVVAVAVQDHGVAPRGMSDRAFRFAKMEAMLRRDRRPETFQFSEEDIPECFLRMKSAVNAVRRDSGSPVVVMDTSYSAILGCIEGVREPSLVVNVGNGHTIAAVVDEGGIEGLYEHHTHELNPERLEKELRLFCRGELSSQAVFEENGHGVVTLKPFSVDLPVLVTGPNRDLFEGTSLRFVYAAPGGNTMMTGPMGLIRAAQSRFATGRQRS